MHDDESNDRSEDCILCHFGVVRPLSATERQREVEGGTVTESDTETERGGRDKQADRQTDRDRRDRETETDRDTVSERGEIQRERKEKEKVGEKTRRGRDRGVRERGACTAAYTTTQH